MTRLLAIAMLATTASGAAMAQDAPAPSDVVYEDGAVAQSLTGQAGDPEAGALIMNKGAGNCVACHKISDLPQYSFQGEIGPALDGVADRWSEAELRGIVANAKMMFPETMMPSFYKNEGYIRVGNGFTGKAAEGPVDPLLSAQQVEDAVAYLMTLKEE